MTLVTSAAKSTGGEALLQKFLCYTQLFGNGVKFWLSWLKFIVIY
jgi:hypothetical protein